MAVWGEYEPCRARFAGSGFAPFLVYIQERARRPGFNFYMF